MERPPSGIASFAATLAGVALVGLGAAALVTPARASHQYGIALDDAEDAGARYVRAVGVRDAVLGGIVLSLVLLRARRALSASFALLTAVAIADLLLNLTYDERRPASLGLHGAGTIGLVGIWALLRAGI